MARGFGKNCRVKRRVSVIGVVFVVFCLAAHAARAWAQADTARLIASLEAITGGDDGAARRDAIVAQLKALGIEPTIEPFGEGRTAGANIAVSMRGAGGKTILVGAHYDRVTVGRGAVDNGASCAALIELVAAFTASPLERSTLEIVFFDREENGLLGSRAYLAAGHRPDYAVNLDIFAYGDAIFAAVSHETGLLRRSLRAAGEAARLPVRDVPPTRYPGSDHLTMVGAGIETLGLALIDADEIDAVIAAVTDKTSGKVPRVLRLIHSPNDTLAEVRPAQMSGGIALVEDLLRRVDRGE
jgi:aminopeptidase S